MNSLSTSDIITYSTIRIETFSEGTGTGFFFDFNSESPNDKERLVIITNWHVIEGVNTGQLIFTKIDDKGNPLDTEHITVVLENFESLWIPHPDVDVDLCILPIKSIIEKIPENFFNGHFDISHLPKTDELEKLCALEEIIMVGYPNGTWDEYNNKPIIRKGITATNPRLKYGGEDEFLIDAACFPGSSGSPVIIYNTGHYLDRDDNHYLVRIRVVLLGVLRAGPEYTAEGDIKFVDIKKQKIVNTEMPYNLGNVISIGKILDFEELI
ncbi:serine protease [Flavobacterium sp.]|uniref:S1 family peptidase n=1 Tax=Flavobacterium sp. TaxID=239 RepID=UPI0038FCDE43